MLKAIADRIIIKPEEKKSGAILINAEQKFTGVGVVQSVGERVRGVKEGDKVAFHRFDELPLEDEGLVVIRQKSLLGIWE